MRPQVIDSADAQSFGEPQHRIHELERAAENWSKAKRIPEYVLTVIDEHKRAGEELGPDTPTGIWVVWALQHADRLDPLVKSPPSILDRKKELGSEQKLPFWVASQSPHW